MGIKKTEPFQVPSNTKHFNAFTTKGVYHIDTT